MTDWNSAVVMNPEELRGLRDRLTGLARARRRLLVLAAALAGLSLATLPRLWFEATRTEQLRHALAECRGTLDRNGHTLSALSTSHQQLLNATAHAPSMDTHSWGRRFEITMYVPRSPKYGRFNDGFTATMKKADPNARIAAVDPALIPYGSRLWIEGLGWYNAEDCGVAIKGFRLDLLAATHDGAMEFGRQRRFVIVVPPDTNDGSSAPAPGMIGFAPKDGPADEAKAGAGAPKRVG
jgi:3D (Asp-Asp-Asp) domain-containing protein